MAGEIKKTLTQFINDFANNSSGNITPALFRNFVVSTFNGGGSIKVLSGTTSITAQDLYDFATFNISAVTAGSNTIITVPVVTSATADQIAVITGSRYTFVNTSTTTINLDFGSQNLYRHGYTSVPALTSTLFANYLQVPEYSKVEIAYINGAWHLINETAKYLHVRYAKTDALNAYYSYNTSTGVYTPSSPTSSQVIDGFNAWTTSNVGQTILIAGQTGVRNGIYVVTSIVTNGSFVAPVLKRVYPELIIRFNKILVTAGSTLFSKSFELDKNYYFTDTQPQYDLHEFRFNQTISDYTNYKEITANTTGVTTVDARYGSTFKITGIASTSTGLNVTNLEAGRVIQLILIVNSKPSTWTYLSNSFAITFAGVGAIQNPELETGTYFIELTAGATASETYAQMFTAPYSVVNQHLARMTQNTLKGNNTASTAQVTDISVNTNSIIGRRSGNITNIPFTDVEFIKTGTSISSLASFQAILPSEYLVGITFQTVSYSGTSYSGLNSTYGSLYTIKPSTDRLIQYFIPKDSMDNIFVRGYNYSTFTSGTDLSGWGIWYSAIDTHKLAINSDDYSAGYLFDKLYMPVASALKKVAIPEGGVAPGSPAMLQLSVNISTDSNNAIVNGTDGGLFVQQVAASDTKYSQVKVFDNTLPAPNGYVYKSSGSTQVLAIPSIPDQLNISAGTWFDFSITNGAGAIFLNKAAGNSQTHTVINARVSNLEQTIPTGGQTDSITIIGGLNTEQHCRLIYLGNFSGTHKWYAENYGVGATESTPKKYISLPFFRDGAGYGNALIGPNNGGSDASGIRVPFAGTIKSVSWDMVSGSSIGNIQYQIESGSWITLISNASASGGLTDGLSISVSSGQRIKLRASGDNWNSISVILYFEET